MEGCWKVLLAWWPRGMELKNGHEGVRSITTSHLKIEPFVAQVEDLVDISARIECTRSQVKVRTEC